MMPRRMATAGFALMIALLPICARADPRAGSISGLFTTAHIGTCFAAAGVCYTVLGLGLTRWAAKRYYPPRAARAGLWMALLGFSGWFLYYFCARVLQMPPPLYVQVLAITCLICLAVMLRQTAPQGR